MEKLNKQERFVCEILWGGIPVDTIWVRESKMFIEGMKRYENGEFKEVEMYKGIVRETPKELTKDFITFPLVDDPYSSINDEK